MDTRQFEKRPLGRWGFVKMQHYLTENGGYTHLTVGPVHDTLSRFLNQKWKFQPTFKHFKDISNTLLKTNFTSWGSLVINIPGKVSPPGKGAPSPSNIQGFKGFQ